MCCIAGVLVGGLSTRMGHPKAALPHPDGRTLVEHVVDVVRQCGEWIDQLVLLERRGALTVGEVYSTALAGGRIQGLDPTASEEQMLANINTPADYAHLR